MKGFVLNFFKIILFFYAKNYFCGVYLLTNNNENMNLYMDNEWLMVGYSDNEFSVNE